MNKNCYIWTRVSTKHQEENGASLDDQKCKCEKYAHENGYTIKSQKGSHIKLEKNGYIVIVPNHGKKGVEKGTYHSILRQAGLK